MSTYVEKSVTGLFGELEARLRGGPKDAGFAREAVESAKRLEELDGLGFALYGVAL